jgi:hypothetical protein
MRDYPSLIRSRERAHGHAPATTGSGLPRAEHPPGTGPFLCPIFACPWLWNGCRSWGTSTPARRPCRPRGGLGVKRFFRLLPAALRFALHRPTAVVLGGTDSPYRAFGAWDGASCIRTTEYLRSIPLTEKSDPFHCGLSVSFHGCLLTKQTFTVFFFYYLGTMKSVVLIFL